MCSLCAQCEIDEKINKSILNHISIQELVSKIEFLQSKKVPIVYESGMLHEIFSMSGADMKEKYDFRTDEMIDEYYIKKELVKEYKVCI